MIWVMEERSMSIRAEITHKYALSHPLPQLLGFYLFACRSANYALSTDCKKSRIINLITIKRQTLMAFILS